MLRLGRIARLFLAVLAVIPIVGSLAAFVLKQRIAPVDDPMANEIRLAAIFEPILYRSTAPAFRGGTIDFWYGGGVVDLRDATLDPAGAHLDVRTVFGGGQILVPETWKVTGHVLGIGGFADARPRVDHGDTAPQLTITGVAVFGGFAVSSKMSDAETRDLETVIARMARRRSGQIEASVDSVPAL
jgi:hypothetical protein